MSSTRTARNGTPKTLSAKQVAAITALLASGNREQAAKDSGVSKGTLYRWLRTPAFITALQAAERDALADVSRQLVSLSSLAADTLRDAMQDPDAKLNERIRAAEAVLNQLMKLRELLDLEGRLSDLESRIEGLNHANY
jgi:hypothetical protein